MTSRDFFQLLFHCPMSSPPVRSTIVSKRIHNVEEPDDKLDNDKSSVVFLFSLNKSRHSKFALILFEKVRGKDARFQDIFSTLYTDYKLKQNYSTEEIIGKTRSLKGILEPFSTDGNIDMMKRAGFVDITTVMKYLCFEGFLAIK